MLKEMGFYKGVNLGGWLSQCDYSDERLDHFIEEKDFETIASWRLDHVRIPFDYNVIENEDGSYKEEGFDRISRGVQNALKNGLNVVLDLHKTAGFSFDSGEKELGFFEDEALQERFYRLWEEMAKRFGHDPAHVVFELLNEVTDQSFSKTWNRISDTCIKRIRAIAPDVVILVGSYWNNSASAVKDLDPPQDARVVYNFHCYEPLKFTHQGAHWDTGLCREDRFSFAESGASEEYFEELFSSAIEKAAKEGAELYCGEYGVIDIVPTKEALPWFKAIHAAFEKHGIARAVWSYRQMDFGLADERWDADRDELLKYL